MFIYTQPYTKVVSLLKNLKGESLKRVDFFLDIQNLSQGVYVPKDETHESNLEEVIWYEFFSLLTTLGRSIVECKSYGVDVHYYLYFDRGRNLFNEKIVPTWKQHRRKQLVDLIEKDSEGWFLLTLQNSAVKIVYELLGVFSQYSKHLHFVKLHYIDSDFIPGFFRVLRKMTGTYYRDDRHVVIVSSDSDYLHQIDSHCSILYTVTQLRKTDFGNINLIANVENTLQRLMKKFQLKDRTEAITLFKFYPLFHALSGDGSDSMSPVISGFSWKSWFKTLKDPLSEYLTNEVSKWSLYEDLLHESKALSAIRSSVEKCPSSKLCTELQSNGDVQRLLFRRLLVTDHELLSYVILSLSDELLLQLNVQEQDCFEFQFAKKVAQFLTLDEQELLAKVANTVYESLTKKSLPRSEVNRFLSWAKTKWQTLSKRSDVDQSRVLEERLRVFF